VIVVELPADATAATIPCQATGCMRVGEIRESLGEATLPPPATVTVMNPTGSVAAVLPCPNDAGVMGLTSVAVTTARRRRMDAFVFIGFVVFVALGGGIESRDSIVGQFRA
jgi:hypothetical protein